jgi:proline dehydrogenase
VAGVGRGALVVLKSAMLWLAESERAEGVIRRSRVARPLVDRFVAGEDLDTAIEHARVINANGMAVSLDLLGESVIDEAEARAAGDAYIGILDRIQETGVNSNISIKLTMLGLDIADEFAWQQLERIIARADELGNFVRIDMEASAYTERTLALFRRIHDLCPQSVGIVLQSCLYRTDRDLEEMIECQARVRIVKGAYLEPPSVAYPHKADVDEAFQRHVERLLEAGNYPAIATHDDRILRAAWRFATQNGIERSRFEFQMLYGVRRDMQEQLVDQGYNMRVYVPYGRSWYPYFTRRLAERPANVLFIAKAIARG